MYMTFQKKLSAAILQGCYHHAARVSHSDPLRCNVDSQRAPCLCDPGVSRVSCMDDAEIVICTGQFCAFSKVFPHKGFVTNFTVTVQNDLARHLTAVARCSFYPELCSRSIHFARYVCLAGTRHCTHAPDVAYIAARQESLAKVEARTASPRATRRAAPRLLRPHGGRFEARAGWHRNSKIKRNRRKPDRLFFSWRPKTDVLYEACAK